MDKVRPLTSLAEVTDHLNRIIEKVNAHDNLAVGPGLQKSVTSMGMAIGLTAPPGNRTQSTPTDCSGGTEKVLGSAQGTQDTDTWVRSTDKCPVSIAAITDIKYDPATLKLTYRVRVMHFDKCGALSSVDAETADASMILVTTAVQC